MPCTAPNITTSQHHNVTTTHLCCLACCPTLQFPGGPPRALEDLKDRYYSIARKLMVAREGTDATLLNQHLLRNPYNANQGVLSASQPLQSGAGIYCNCTFNTA
jgi:hypothetical protein